MGGAGVGGRLTLLSRSFTRVSSEVACGAWLVIHEPHTSINPEFRSVDPLRTLPVYLKLTGCWVGWLGWLVRVHSIAIIMYDI